MEVIYTGLRQTPEDIVEAAIQEDVDAIGLSCLSGAHMTLFPEVVKLLKKRKSGDILVAGGGIIPEEDVPKLKKAGIKVVLGPGTPLRDIVAFFETAGKGAGGRAGPVGSRARFGLKPRRRPVCRRQTGARDTHLPQCG